MGKYTIKDLTKEQRLLAEENGIKYNTLANRLFDGWEIEKAITEKTNRKGGHVKNVITEEGVNTSLSWFAGTNKGLKCPVPGCTHVGEVITKAHCRIVHGLEREEVKDRYGMPQIIESKGEILSERNGRAKWYSTSNGMGAL